MSDTAAERDNSTAEPADTQSPQAREAVDIAAEAEAELPQARRPRPTGARCDACHERGVRVVRSRDGLLTVCMRCARGADVANNDSADAIAAVVNRTPQAERRLLARRLLARRALHTRRRERRASALPTSAPAPRLPDRS